MAFFSNSWAIAVKRRSILVVPAIFVLIVSGFILDLEANQEEAQPFAPHLYIQDEAGIVREPYISQIVEACREIEQRMRIRILIRTEVLEDITNYTSRVDSIFSDWIREIGLDKRGILLYAALPKDSMNG